MISHNSIIGIGVRVQSLFRGAVGFSCCFGANDFRCSRCSTLYSNFGDTWFTRLVNAVTEGRYSFGVVHQLPDLSWNNPSVQGQCDYASVDIKYLSKPLAFPRKVQRNSIQCLKLVSFGKCHWKSWNSKLGIYYYYGCSLNSRLKYNSKICSGMY